MIIESFQKAQLMKRALKKKNSYVEKLFSLFKISKYVSNKFYRRNNNKTQDRIDNNKTN